MPKASERKLRAQARKKGLKGKRADSYVYGTLRKKFHWEPKKNSVIKGVRFTKPIKT